MMSVDDARARILAAVSPLPPVRLLLLDALGLVLAEEVVAPRDVPPFDNAAMDGYALRAEDVTSAAPDDPIELSVVDNIPAGTLPLQQIRVGCAARIMTGAPIPHGADAVVPYEQTDENRRMGIGRRVAVARAVESGANVRHRGEDVPAGATVFRRGTSLGPAQLGALASLGLAAVAVHRRPRVAILSTGDELLAPGAAPARGRIYDANGPALAAAVVAAGGEPVALGIAPDEPAALQKYLRQAAAVADLVVTSAGVSRGDYDVVKDVLAREGRIDFWEVAIKPGRPLAFGWVGEAPLVGLPGNPVAALVGFEQFIRPAIRKLLGQPNLARPEIIAVLRGQALNRDGRRCFLRARLSSGPEGLIATLVGRHGSGVLSSLASANALVVVPEECPAVADGDRVRAQLIGELEVEWP